MIDKYIGATWGIEGWFDKSDQTKTAAYKPETYIPPDMEKAIATLKGGGADPRFTYIHIVALTDGDFYGPNLNGDIFDTAELTGTQSPSEAAKNTGKFKGEAVPRYKTFEEGKFHRNHANSASDPSYGDIPCAAWNDVMRRVELLVRIAKEYIPELDMTSGADILNKMNKRGFLTTSMGTRISHEKCSICGHENEFVPERCAHLKDMMNEVMPDGRKVAARNFGLRFFEQSEVGIPADPGAYSMSKVASAPVSVAPNPAKDVISPWSVKVSDMEKHAPVSDPVSGVGIDHDCKVIEVIDPADHYTPDEIKSAMVAAGDLTTLLSTAASAGIVFSPIELAMATAYAEPEKVAEDKFDGFGRLAVDKFSVGAYSALQSKIAARSGFLAPLVATGWEPSKIAEQGADGLAAYYAAYRAALSSLPRSSFIKAAQRNPHLRDVAADGDVMRAMSYLTYAGLLSAPCSHG